MTEHGWRDLFGLWPPAEEREAGPPLSRAQQAAVARDVAAYRRLAPASRRRLLLLARTFLARHEFEACGGLALTETMRATIAAQACVLLLGLDAPVYPSLRSVLVYPHSYAAPSRERGNDGVVLEGREGRRGQAGRGVVVLAWDRVPRRGAASEPDQDLVLHEFAHQLAVETGAVDGIPRLADRARDRAWRSELTAAHARLAADVARGRPSFLRAYGARNTHEFFAVLTEAFFAAPAALNEREPRLYSRLRDFYRQDPLIKC